MLDKPKRKPLAKKLSQEATRQKDPTEKNLWVPTYPGIPYSSSTGLWWSSITDSSNLQAADGPPSAR